MFFSRQPGVEPVQRGGVQEQPEVRHPGAADQPDTGIPRGRTGTLLHQAQQSYQGDTF